MGYEFLGTSLKGQEGSSVTTSSLESVPVVALYFSAHWCPPCKLFTPKLTKFYNAVNQNGKRLEIVGVSSDDDLEEFDDYFEDMPWLAVEFEADDVERDDISERFNISAIPNLIVLNKDGTPKDVDAKNDVTEIGVDAFEGWLA